MTTPQENFIGWLEQRYDTPDDPHGQYVCKRCGQEVSYLTKHAAVRHGDDIEVMPAVNRNQELADSY